MNNIVILYQSGSDQNEISLSNWKKYCDKYNLPLIYITDIVNPTVERYKQIFYIFDILKENQIEFDQICLVSDSTLINLSTPNLFNQTDGKLTFAEWDSDFGYLLTQIENYQKNVFQGKLVDYSRFFDFGFFIVNKTHENIFKTICQNLQHNFVGLNFFFDCEYKKLPYTYNMIDIQRKEALDNYRFIKLGNVYNFSGLNNKLELMRSTSNLL